MDAIWVSVQDKPRRIKAAIDKDCLPPDAKNVHAFYSTADLRKRVDRSERFWHMYDKMRWLEEIGFNVCLDFGDYFYETGMQSPDIKDYEAKERVI